MNKKEINFVITDLDDTIWDWFTMWYESFNPFIERISKELNIDIEILKKNFRNLHKKYHSTEASYIYEELDCFNKSQIQQISSENNNQKSIIHEYYSNKKNNLRLFKGSKETLETLHRKGVKIIGFTESNSFFTKYRIKHLEMDGLFDCIYAPLDYKLPASVKKIYQDGTWEPKITKFRYLPHNIKKPAPEILDIIINDFNANKNNSIYIGDKLEKDILMANQADIESIYVDYGNKVSSFNYELLRDVSHWTEQEIKDEISFHNQHKINPNATHVLHESLETLFELYSFSKNISHQNILTDYPEKELDNVIKIWDKTISVQQHFNDLELRIRSIALTTYTFIIGGIGYLEKEGLTFSALGLKFTYSSILSIFSIIIIFGFFFMDRLWYHKLLLGSVKHAAKIEEKWSVILPEITLTTKIGEESPNNFFCYKIHSKNKFWIFYGTLIIPIFILSIVLNWNNIFSICKGIFK